MPAIAYINKNFSAKSLATIQRVNEIVVQYAQQGFGLTLRQLYYQFVSRGYVSNNDREYKNLGSVVNDGRLAGLIDWYAISDRGRWLRNEWENPGTPEEQLEGLAEGYVLDAWENQEFRPEVWVEKDALVDIIGRACQPLGVAYFSCRGYTSQSEMWAAGQRIRRMAREGQYVKIIHLGDHDPSGIDMSRDIAERLSLFSGIDVDFQRIALNMEQVDQYNPPENPAKLTDSRGSSYVRLYGDSSWELDALEPAVLVQLIRDTITPLRDPEPYREVLTRQRETQAIIRKAAEEWPSIVERFKDDLSYDDIDQESEDDFEV